MNKNIEVLALSNIKHTFKQGNSEICILNEANLSLKEGEVVALVGPSGAGKSTLLQIAGLLEKPNSGSVIIDGINCNKAHDKRRTQLRSQYLGFVYQYHYLLPEFSATENVILPQMIVGKSKHQATEKAKVLLNDLGLANREKHRPSKLSGGEQQRVAIARALANNPRILLADEPTGNLDHDTAIKVFNILLKSVRETGLSALIATHNREIASSMDRTLTIEGGIITQV